MEINENLVGLLKAFVSVGMQFRGMILIRSHTMSPSKCASASPHSECTSGEHVEWKRPCLDAGAERKLNVGIVVSTIANLRLSLPTVGSTLPRLPPQ